jgi:ferric-dicitrate binding protein FerR (iron transport regulator)
MDNISTYHSDLITKFLAGEITEEEIQVLTEWLKSAPEHQEFFEELQRIWIAIEKSKIELSDVDAEWNKLEFRIKESQKSKVKSQKSKVKSQKSEVKKRSSDLNVRQSHSNYRINFGFNRAFRIAALFLLIAIPTFLLFRYFNDSGTTIISAQNQMVEANLPDGTFVSLNSGSTLEYPEHFKDNRREVKLTGEAYFDVKHDAKTTFVIVNGKVRIEDIGTSFYVNTNKSDRQMEVILTEGKAAVFFDDHLSGKVVITSGEKVDIWVAGNSIRKSINHDENYMAWKTRRLVFSNNTMSEVVTLLNRVYHSDIHLSGDNINNCRLTAIFDNQTLESVLNVIKSTLDVSIISNGQTFEIRGDKCDQ